jgi:hypothetical protein
MRFKHEHAEKPRIDFLAIPTPPGWDADFSAVKLGVSIYGTRTLIEADVPPALARKYAAEVIAACEIVEGAA